MAILEILRSKLNIDFAFHDWAREHSRQPC